MVGHVVAVLAGNGVLALFDRLIKKLGHLAAAGTDHMVVVVALIDLVDRVAAIEVVARDQAGTLELGQDAIDGGDADFLARLEQRPIDILGAHVALRILLQQLQDTHARQGRFQSRLSQITTGHLPLSF